MALVLVWKTLCLKHTLLKKTYTKTITFPFSQISCQAGVCREYNDGRRMEGMSWRCTVCRSQYNFRKGSFFEKSKLEKWHIIGLIYMWSTMPGRSRGPSQENIRHELDIISEHTVVDWMQFCRDVCQEHFLRHPEVLGGKLRRRNRRISFC